MSVPSLIYGFFKYPMTIIFKIRNRSCFVPHSVVIFSCIVVWLFDLLEYWDYTHKAAIITIPYHAMSLLMNLPWHLRIRPLVPWYISWINEHRMNVEWVWWCLQRWFEARLETPPKPISLSTPSGHMHRAWWHSATYLDIETFHVPLN